MGSGQEAEESREEEIVSPLPLRRVPSYPGRDWVHRSPMRSMKIPAHVNDRLALSFVVVFRRTVHLSARDFMHWIWGCNARDVSRAKSKQQIFQYLPRRACRR